MNDFDIFRWERSIKDGDEHLSKLTAEQTDDIRKRMEHAGETARKTGKSVLIFEDPNYIPPEVEIGVLRRRIERLEEVIK